MNGRPQDVRTYNLSNGDEPFHEWLAELKVKKAHSAILTRIDRLRSGNFGDYKSLGGNLYELRIYYRPGYRVYFGLLEEDIVILLCGGTKKTQRQDIQKAQFYWEEFTRRQS